MSLIPDTSSALLAVFDLSKKHWGRRGRGVERRGAMKCRERHVITVFFATDGDTDMKTSSFHQSHKLIPIHSVSSNSLQFHSYSRYVL